MKSAMEDRSESRCEPPRRMSIGHLPSGEGPFATPSVARVADILTSNAISLPAWFTSAQACAVLRLKARSFVLLADARGIRRIASRARLAAAPSDQALAG